MSSVAAPIRDKKNVQHSTGPRTNAGKAVSSQNAMRHGLASGTLFIAGEDQSEWEALFTSLLDEYSPATATERLLVHNMAKHHWLVERAMRLQGEALATVEPGTLPVSFAVLLRYQTANERAFCRAQKTLEEVQTARREFVSQSEAKAAQQRLAANMSRMSMPFPPPDYDKLIERMAALRQSPPPPAPTAPQS